jgi:hypothetical protein
MSAIFLPDKKKKQKKNRNSYLVRKIYKPIMPKIAMNEKELILINNAKEYFNSAEEELNKERNNTSVVLYFKSLVSLIDLFILQKTGNTPSSHTERFRICEQNFPAVYDLLDKDFPFYQNSYFQKLTKELAEVIKNDAKIMAGKTQVKLL